MPLKWVCARDAHVSLKTLGVRLRGQYWPVRRKSCALFYYLDHTLSIEKGLTSVSFMGKMVSGGDE